MDIDEIVNITSRTWGISILSLLHAGVPGRQATLCSASGASRSAFNQSLSHLMDIGLLERNPGHGHPLRPEFRLTSRGARAAELAHGIHEAAKGKGLVLLRRSWTIPVLGTLREPRHFNEIKRALPTITDRALSISLKAMEGSAWVRRSVDDLARPPRSIYQSMNNGEAISRAVADSLRP